MAEKTRVEFGDWQTPPALAQQVVSSVKKRLGFTPRTILEPTCGLGSFLVAAMNQFPDVNAFGFDINAEYINATKSALGDKPVDLRCADFFSVNWEAEVSKMEDPVLVIGNPPWVTSAGLGALASTNVPRKINFKKLNGLDALTGKSNFDVSEWMLLRLLQALRGRSFALAVLCKTAVARRLIEGFARDPSARYKGSLFGIDAMRHFSAAVDAVLLLIENETNEHNTGWPFYKGIEEEKPASVLGVIDGTLCNDIEQFHKTRRFEGVCSPEWRSGIKHDCSAVMEFDRRNGALINGNGEVADLEESFVYPLMKSSDVANQRTTPTRAVLVTQRTLGEDTSKLQRDAPKAWEYLWKHRKSLQQRKSSIYQGQPPFSIFGVGSYTFAPWKIAISGLYKRLEFSLVGPHNGRPVLFDDTCYFLPFDTEAEATSAMAALRSKDATDFLSARIFWDAKRPISKAILQSLSLSALQGELGLQSAHKKTTTTQHTFTF